MPTSLRGIANQAKADKKRRFTNLSQLLTYEYLVENFMILNKKAATGIDGVSHREYAKTITTNITKLIERVKSGKWLKAGVVAEDGQIIKLVEGTPQGGVISPILANVYLHYALDLWFEKEIKLKCEGDAYHIRFVDDYVALFRYARDAEMFYSELPGRLKKFGLELAKEKTRIGSFSRFRKYEKTSFSFLGIKFRWGKSNNGKDVISGGLTGKG